MFAVTDRTEPARGFRPQSLPTQAGRHGFYVIHPSLSTKLIRQAWRTIALFCVTECFPDDVITNKAELLTPVYLMTTLMPDVPAATGNLKYTAHGFDTELSLMWSDHAPVDSFCPHGEAFSKASGLTPPRWLWRRLRL